MSMARPTKTERATPCPVIALRGSNDLSGGVDLDICIPLRTVSSSDLTTARLGGGRRLRDRIVGFLKTELSDLNGH
jgi:hypothetical protein